MFPPKYFFRTGVWPLASPGIGSQEFEYIPLSLFNGKGNSIHLLLVLQVDITGVVEWGRSEADAMDKSGAVFIIEFLSDAIFCEP